jgi:hypothetical protein
MKKYPEVTELFRRKAQRRKRLARLSFEEKIAIVNKWRKLTKSIRKSQGAMNQASITERRRVGKGR